MTYDGTTELHFKARIERLFEVCVLLLAANGSLTLLLSGAADVVTGSLVVVALAVRGWRIAIGRALKVPRGVATAAAIAVIGFYPLDMVYVSDNFVAATVRLMFLFTALKVLIAEKTRDYFYLGILAFLHLLTASMFVGGPAFLVVLLIFVMLAATAYTTYEVRRGAVDGGKTAVAAIALQALGRKTFALGTMLASGILLGGVILFFALPRPRLMNASPTFRSDLHVGFSQQVDLSQTGSLTPDTTPVMRVQALEETDVEQLRWRGIVLYRFDGVRWSAGRPRAKQLSGLGGGYAMRPGHDHRIDQGRQLHYRVALEPLASDALFLAGQPERIHGTFRSLLLTATDSILVPSMPANGLHYEASAWLPDRSKLNSSDVVELYSRRFEDMYLALPDLDPRIAPWTVEVVGDARSPLRQAERIEKYLQSEFGYTLDLPSSPVEDPLAHFLFERREGHCEYFATSMAVMLRALGIPSRLVNGFAGGMPNPLTGMQVLRSSDAHSWVEAYIPGYGWLEFDPTPLRPPSDVSPLLATLWLYWDAVQSAWTDWVVSYDTQQQAELARSLQEESRAMVLDATLTWEALLARLEQLKSKLSATGAALGATGSWVWAIPALAALAAPWLIWLLLGRLSVAWRKWRLARGFARESDSQFFYRRALSTLAKRGVVRAETQTGEELERRIPDVGLRKRFAQVLRCYNAARFGRDPAAERELPSLVEQLERA